jgi:UDP-glucose 4-epimerase
MNVYGARQDYKGAYIAVIMKILDRLDRGLPPLIYGDGSQAYDFIYVSDVAHANVCALKGNATDKFYNIGMGTQTTINELCELVLEITGADVEIQYETAGQTFVVNRVGSTEKAKRDLGFEAKVDLQEGLTRLIEWRKSHKLPFGEVNT